MEIVRDLQGHQLLHEPLGQDWAELFHGWLACEWRSESRTDIQALVSPILESDKVDRLVWNPDFSSAEENWMREQVIGLWRIPLIVQLPLDCRWHVARLDPGDWENLRWFDQRRMTDVLASIQSDPHSTVALKVRDSVARLRRGERPPGKPIAVTRGMDGPVCLLDGNHRATAFATVIRENEDPKFDPRIFLAVSPNMTAWPWYPS